MNILSVSKNDREAVVLLSSEELVLICNTLYKAPDNYKKDLFYKLYCNMMIARDMSQYGSLDAFCLEKVLEYRNYVKKDF